MSTFIENQNWRYATKNLILQKSRYKDIEILKEAIQLSTSSYGLQPYKIFFIENPEVRHNYSQLFGANTNCRRFSLNCFCKYQQIR